jgi:hypothetical protein
LLVMGVPWRVLPREIGCWGITAWRRLGDWQAAGVWDRLHRELLRRLKARGRLDWSTGVVDGSHIRALRGGPLTGRSPVDRARAGSKHHLIVDCHGVPLAATLTAIALTSRNCCPSSMGSARSRQARSASPATGSGDRRSRL